MATTIYDWPEDLLPGSYQFYPVFQTTDRAEATNGFSRSLGYVAASWRLKLENIPQYTSDQVRKLRKIVGYMGGDTQLVRIRLPDLYGAGGRLTQEKYDIDQRRKQYPKGEPFSDGTFFDDGYGFAIESDYTQFLEQDSGLNDQRLYVSGLTLPEGVYVSIDDFMYTVVDTSTPGQIDIRPPLRKAATAGTAIESEPVFIGYCITSNPGAYSLNSAGNGRVTLEFQEDLRRLRE
ncbi:hypothetical protein [Pseudovibrio sp. SPO723]|uniref:hypothetical protein n=1 Tax=Nesiotobacter zosterae TaxID=392721 RepID=UPI0029C31B4B|nr:hypothetical protein [Pseudovibrio sp. SPO723]MDX5592583.1 hypothetical protein [Pseudovibrio sp. SPO723]